MDLRHMRQFVAVAEELHFGRAAIRLRMAQPPLSQAIKRLEADLGVDLFDRSKRSVALTPAGRILLIEAKRTLQQAEIARKLVQRSGEKLHEVRVSFIGPALYQLLPGLLVEYRHARPEIHVRLHEKTSPEQIEAILAGDFDVGFVTSALKETGECETVLVERTRFVAAVPVDSILAGRSSVTLAEMAEQPLITTPPRYQFQSDNLQIFKKFGHVPYVVQQSTQTNTTLSLVGAGLGSALVMASAMLTNPKGVAFAAIDELDTQVRWELAMAWHPQHLSQLGEDFVGFAKKYVEEHPELMDPNALALSNIQAK